MKKLPITFIAILISLSGFSQRSTYLGAEGGVAYDIYNLSDNGSKVESTPLRTGFWGINLRQDLNKTFALETGLIRKYYQEGFEFEVHEINALTSHNLANTVESHAYKSWQIPLRLKSKMNLFKEKIFFSTTIGYHFGINTDFGSGISGGGKIYQMNGDVLTYTFSTHPYLSRTFSLLETGAGFEFKLFNKALLSLNASYYTGFKNVVRVDINYYNNGDPSTTAKAYSKGEYWNIALGIKYPISVFWGKKE